MAKAGYTVDYPKRPLGSCRLFFTLYGRRYFMREFNGLLALMTYLAEVMRSDLRTDDILRANALYAVQSGNRTFFDQLIADAYVPMTYTSDQAAIAHEMAVLQANQAYQNLTPDCMDRAAALRPEMFMGMSVELAKKRMDWAKDMPHVDQASPDRTQHDVALDAEGP